MNTRITTVRIPEDRIQEIDELCEHTGSCRNAWINAAIDFALDKSSDYDFGNDEEEKPDPR